MNKLKEILNAISGLGVLIGVIFLINDLSGHKFFNTVFITRIEVDRTNEKVEYYGINILEKLMVKKPSDTYLESQSHKPEGMITIVPTGEYRCFYDTDTDTLRVTNAKNIVWYNIKFEDGLGEGVELNAGCKFVIKD